jgi:hypothetical protein
MNDMANALVLLLNEEREPVRKKKNLNIVKWRNLNFHTWTRIKYMMQAVIDGGGIVVTCRRMNASKNKAAKKRRRFGSPVKKPVPVPKATKKSVPSDIKKKLFLGHFLQISRVLALHGRFTDLAHDCLLCLNGQTQDGSADGEEALYDDIVTDDVFLDSWASLYETITTIPGSEKVKINPGTNLPELKSHDDFISTTFPVSVDFDDEEEEGEEEEEDEENVEEE